MKGSKPYYATTQNVKILITILKWSGIIREIREREPGAEAGMIFGFLAAGRGIGSVLSGPLSEALLHGKPWSGDTSLGYGTGYGGLIIFTGVSAALGSVSWVGRRLGWV